MKLHSLALIALTSGALLFACSDGGDPVNGRPVSITPAAIDSAAEVNTRLVAQALWDAQQWLAQSVTLTDLGDVLLPADVAPEPVAAAGGANYLIFPQEEDGDFQAALDDIVAFLDERVFAHDAVESESDTEVVYRVTADRFCDPAWDEDEDTGELYEACTDILGAVEVRLAVTSYAEGDLDVAVLIGADRRETFVIELHQTLAAVTIRVGPTLEAALEIDAALNGDDPEYAAPALNGSGSVRIAARRLTETRTRVAIELPDAVEMHGQVGVDQPVFGFAAGPGSASLDVDRVAETGQLDVDLRDFTVSGPKEAIQDLGDSSAMTCIDMEGYESDCYYEDQPEPVEGTFEFSIARLAGLIDLSDEQQELAIEGLLAGPIALYLDEQRVLGFDLDGGQTPVDLTMTPTEDRVDFALSHATTLSASFRLEDAADLWPDLTDTFLAHDDLGATLDGAAPWFSVRDNGFVVESGSIALTSTARPDLDRTLEAVVCAWYSDQGDWAEDGSGSASASADGSDGSPLPPSDATDVVDDDARHLLDFETGPTCPEYDDAPPTSSANGGAN